jgi:hypothetical protein
MLNLTEYEKLVLKSWLNNYYYNIFYIFNVILFNFYLYIIIKIIKKIFIITLWLDIRSINKERFIRKGFIREKEKQWVIKKKWINIIKHLHLIIINYDKKYIYFIIIYKFIK